MEDFDQSRLVHGAGELWDLGTSARFLDAAGNGTLPEEAFSRWLVQDYLFVRGFATFVSLLIAKSPRPIQTVLIKGLTAVDNELDWFESHADQRNLDLSTNPDPVCSQYVDFLIAAAHTQPLEVLLAILFGVEVAYTVAWGRLKPEGPYAEFIDRWTHPDFRAYVHELKDLAETHPQPRQQEFFNRVMRHERDFWRMTWEG